jgi:hypothetical protein
MRRHGRAAGWDVGDLLSASYAGVGREERHHVCEQSTRTESQDGQDLQEQQNWGHEIRGKAVIMFVWFSSLRSRYV